MCWTEPLKARSLIEKPRRGEVVNGRSSQPDDDIEATMTTAAAPWSLEKTKI